MEVLVLEPGRRLVVFGLRFLLHVDQRVVHLGGVLEPGDVERVALAGDGEGALHFVRLHTVHVAPLGFAGQRGVFWQGGNEEVGHHRLDLARGLGIKPGLVDGRAEVGKAGSRHGRQGGVELFALQPFGAEPFGGPQRLFRVLRFAGRLVRRHAVVPRVTRQRVDLVLDRFKFVPRCVFQLRLERSVFGRHANDDVVADTHHREVRPLEAAHQLVVLGVGLVPVADQPGFRLRVGFLRDEGVVHVVHRAVVRLVALLPARVQYLAGFVVRTLGILRQRVPIGSECGVRCLVLGLQVGVGRVGERLVRMRLQRRGLQHQLG